MLVKHLWGAKKQSIVYDYILWVRGGRVRIRVSGFWNQLRGIHFSLSLMGSPGVINIADYRYRYLYICICLNFEQPTSCRLK